MEYLAYSPSQERSKKSATTAIPFDHNIGLLKGLPDRPWVKQGKAEDDSEGNIMIDRHRVRNYDTVRIWTIP